MPWHARLQLDYTLGHGRTVARFAHEGPLRILQSLYPEGDTVCHNVMVHPPGGIVGGDTLDVTVKVATGAHGLVTTPGATRFYRSSGPQALQKTQLTLAERARLEWLPLEAICYNACQAENHLTLQLAEGAECMGWDVTALGLPHAGQPFEQGRFTQHIEMPGHWLERGVIDAQDALLMNSPLGMAGQRCLASLFFATGSALGRERREALLETARAKIESHALRPHCGATSPNDHTVVVRALAGQVEPVMDLFKQIRAAWRSQLWGLDAGAPRIWAM